MLSTNYVSNPILRLSITQCALSLIASVHQSTTLSIDYISPFPVLSMPSRFYFYGSPRGLYIHVNAISIFVWRSEWPRCCCCCLPVRCHLHRKRFLSPQPDSKGWLCSRSWSGCPPVGRCWVRDAPLFFLSATSSRKKKNPSLVILIPFEFAESPAG